jgi:hypothetical protein
MSAEALGAKHYLEADHGQAPPAALFAALARDNAGQAQFGIRLTSGLRQGWNRGCTPIGPNRPKRRQQEDCGRSCRSDPAFVSPIGLGEHPTKF